MSQDAPGDERPPIDGFRARIGRSKLARADFLLLLPLLAAIVFVAHFASPIPVTDEWLFLQADFELEGVDELSREGFAKVREVFPAKLSEHWIVVPYLVYHAIAERGHYDSRVFMYLTVALYALQAWLFRKRLIPSTWWALPVIVLLFSPSHYVEMLWGWQYTLALSIAFSLVGLWIVDRVSATQSVTRQAAWIGTGILCFTAGTLSAASGIFGFPCAAFLLALKPAGWIRKACWSVAFLVPAYVLKRQLMSDAEFNVAPRPDDSFQFLTSLGGPILGTPHVHVEFGIDAWSIIGLVVVLCSIAILVRAARIRALGEIALPLGIAAFGVLCLASTAASRWWLGNWHLAMALPALCGMYAAGWRLWRIDRTRSSAVPFFALFGLLVLGAAGWWTGWTKYAPKLTEFHDSIESFARRYLDEPEIPIPYPGSIHLTPELILFLAANGHPSLDDIAPPASTRPVPAGTRAFLGKEEVGLPLTVANVGKPRMLTVAVPTSAGARGVVARIGESTIVLRPIKARHNLVRCCREEGTRCFAGMILSAPLTSGPEVVELSLFD